MSSRIVTPELLDHLPPNDPMALRSRKDLRWINRLMGNERWICRTIRQHSLLAKRAITEIGAGDGFLIHQLAHLYPTAPIAAYDLTPLPQGLAPRICWHEGDLFLSPVPESGGVLIANLFLHHFEGAQLKELGLWLQHFDLLIFNEPNRAKIPHWFGRLLHPFLHSVTRHDLHVSIDAGFAPGEIATGLDLHPARWTIRETSTWQGSRRVVAWRT